MSTAIKQYKASDGQDITLTPENVQRYIVSGNSQAPEREVVAFMAKCAARGLNPFAGDAYMVCYRQKDGTVKANVIVSKDYFIRTAYQQPDFDGISAGVVVIAANGQMVRREGALKVAGEQLIGGWAVVYRKDISHPTKAEVSFAEYTTGKSLWGSKPATMIRKVALVQALREAYPQAYAGIYDRDEMPQEYAQQPQAVEVEDVATPEPEPEEAPAQPTAPQNTQAIAEMRKVFANYRDSLELDAATAWGNVMEYLNITDGSELTDELARQAIRWMGGEILNNSPLVPTSITDVVDGEPVEDGINF